MGEINLYTSTGLFLFEATESQQLTKGIVLLYNFKERLFRDSM